MSPRRVGAVCRKELRHILRDARSLTMALAFPPLLLLLFGYALNLDVDRIPVLVYDADQSATSRELIQLFQSSRYFDVRGFTHDYAAIEAGIDRNEILLGLAVPRNYSRNIEAGGRADVQILLDGSDSNTASIALGYAEALVGSYSFKIRSAGANRGMGTSLNLPVDPRVRVFYNGMLESKNYMVPGLAAAILMIIASLLTSLTIAREWEMGTLEQLLSTPVRPGEIVLGKMLAFFAIGAIDALSSLLAAVYIFNVPVHGSVLLLAATTCVFLCGVFFWGLLLSSIAKTQLLAYQLGILTSFLPAFLLSGFIYEIDNMPEAIQVVTRFVPVRYFITILRGIMLKGVGLDVLWIEILFLSGFAVMVFVLATKKLSQKLV